MTGQHSELQRRAVYVDLALQSGRAVTHQCLLSDPKEQAYSTSVAVRNDTRPYAWICRATEVHSGDFGISRSCATRSTPANEVTARSGQVTHRFSPSRWIALRTASTIHVRQPSVTSPFLSNGQGNRKFEWLTRTSAHRTPSSMVGACHATTAGAARTEIRMGWFTVYFRRLLFPLRHSADCSEGHRYAEDLSARRRRSASTYASWWDI